MSAPSTQTSLPRPRRGLAALMLSLSLPFGGVTAQGQTFEYVYGSPTIVAGADIVQLGSRRVTPVSACPEAGFVAVGTTYDGTSVDVYVARTRPNGSPIWEYVYDLGPGRLDWGNALAEARDGTGYVITGSSIAGDLEEPGADSDVLLLKIDCDGRPLWAFTYQGESGEYSHDVVEARTGDPSVGTHPGDLLVAGRALTLSGRDDAFLLRTSASGTLIWDQRYNVDGSDASFRALTEARPLYPAMTGDIVAVGGSGHDGFAARVDGNTGALGAAPQGAATYGDAHDQEFWSVVELSRPPHRGSLVMAGWTVTDEGSSAYVVRTGAFPPLVAAHRRIGDANVRAIALDLREVRFPLTLASPGQIALTGITSRDGVPGSDAFLLVADPSSVVPVAGTGRTYGSGEAWGSSLADLPNGFMIAGMTGGSPGGGLYLVRTDPAGATSCERRWDPPHDSAPYPSTRVTPTRTPFLRQVEQEVFWGEMRTAYRECSPSFPAGLGSPPTDGQFRKPADRLSEQLGPERVEK